MMTIKQPRVGSLRPSQIMFTYGVGAIVDLPYLSVIVMGLDDWPADPGVTHEITEDRLLRIVRWELGSQVQKLLAPPAIADAGNDPFSELARIGVPVASFPRWMLCPRCQLLAPLSSSLFEIKHDAFHPERTQYVHKNCQKGHRPLVVPARFLVACENGHLDDFPWVEFVHEGPSDCGSILRLIEYGATGEARDLEVRCETCSKSRRLSQAFGEAGRARMPKCRARRPHLRDYDPQECDQKVRAILVGASNLWFPDVLTTLAIPAESARLAQLVEQKWAVLQNLTSLQNVTLLRQIGQLGDFVGYGDEEIWQAIESRRAREQGAVEEGPIELKQPEWEMLVNPASAPSTEDFRLREVSVPVEFEPLLARVVLVERMREVRALIGFTRIEAPGEMGEEPEDVGERRMRLSRRDPLWAPATEVRGEGIFIQFKESAILDWLSRPAVKQRDQEFSDAHYRWRKARGVKPPEAHDPHLRYVLLHSFAHALMRQLTLECGYTAASVRERIYSRGYNESDAHPEPMAGVLIYTAAPDSEGTLGGLVSLGEPNELRRHIFAALHDARLCASDPLCAEHLPTQEQGMTLHAAACHACLFVPETSCERGNKYLDRSVLVPTWQNSDMAFFKTEEV